VTDANKAPSSSWRDALLPVVPRSWASSITHRARVAAGWSPGRVEGQ
jgi:hypothetical protein